MAYIQFSMPTAAPASTLGDAFIAQVRNMTTEELKLAHEALSQHQRCMELLTFKCSDRHTDCFDVLHDENDYRLEVLEDEFNRRSNVR